ncbi:MAG: DUF4956 domain-containing protein [Saprospiraceae bacterium]|nr:DUF4956 domain-containing protein [Saprospiraceae bacterium]MBK9221627.1 DUF4956 domain-containing protein [Saprospiraceae bacterium]MBK9721434.1 DUF4956 domain-containing protein [Saprospiraceae bacterium]MBK9728499.1 DUF4956 domain-containing protein [Saprospiraceae bacterium]
MFDFSLTNINTDNPSPLSVLYALLLSFFLSSLIAFTYEKTTGHNQSPGHFIQSMILGSIIAAIVAQAVGDSIGRGLGMLGVLAMIRFRTNINQPRNMIFIFAALASGIACGVFAFNIALYGCVLFCVLAFLLDLSPLSNYPKKSQTIKVTFDQDARIGEKSIREYFVQAKIAAELIRIDISLESGRTDKSYIWEVKSSQNIDENSLIESISALSEVKSIRYNLRSEEESI